MLTTLITFLIVLSVLVLVHELGHFIVAKKTGIKVEEFGFGLPPQLWSKKIGGTYYSINALPIGGFVKLYGEDEEPASKKSSAKDAYFSKPKRVRFAVVVAGVLMNFLLAILIFSAVYTKLGIPVKTDTVRIVDVSPKSPAETAGLSVGDVIISVNGQKIDDTEKFSKIVKELAGKEISLEIQRKNSPCQNNVLGAAPGIVVSCKGENMLLSIIPRVSPPPDEGPLGVVISQTEMKFYPPPEQIFFGTIEGFKEALSWTSLILSSLRTMVYQLFVQGTVPQDIAGPVGIFQVTGIVAKTGILSVLQFLAILSVNLAVVNILPLPALDGGRVLFIVIEAVTRKRVQAHIERWVHNVGMIILLFLILLITINDVSRIIQTSGIISRIKSALPF